MGSTINDRYLSEEKLDQIRRLNEIASGRNQSLAQMALAWVLREKAVTSRTDRGQQCETAGEQRTLPRSSGVFGRGA